ncbi:MAG TPA: tetratricopeptide repeat protein, partial [Pyrinomonadaceae bacterium]|nr:tetratricopeptide repeat protein [Pyrinomonadaceae bacterium]
AEVIPLPPNIPRPPVVGFVARRDAQGRDIIERLRAELAPERGRLVALWGPGGAGKSTLAAEAVRALIELFPGGVVWASALDRADFTSATLLDEVATQLGRSDLRTLAPAEKEMQVAALLAARPALVVLDNFETIAEGERGRCVKFLAERAACPALVTTRSPVEEALDIPLDAMTLEEAREFLRRLVGETRKPENFDRLDRDDLIRRCEANPLVLQWVVKQIDLALPPQTVLGYLAQGEGDAARRVFTRSFELPQVGEDGRAALLALSLFVPSASRPALAEVSGFGDDLRRLDKAVEGLSALWLVEATEGNERLFLRGLTSELAKSHLSKDSRADEFHRRFVAHFLRHAEAHRQPTPEDYDALEAEKDNLLGATDSAYSLEDWPSMWTIAYALAVPTVGMLYVRGYWDEALRRNKQALEAARFVRNERLIALSTQGLATISHSRGDLDEARRLYGESLEIAKRLDDQRHIALITWGLGNISKDQGNTKEAKKLFQESLKTFRQSKDEKNTAGVLHQLAMLAQAQGDSAEAQRLYGESLEIAKRLNNQTNIASTLHQLAILAQDQGDMEEARRLYGESLKIKKRLGNQDGIAISLWALGLLTEREGNKLEAARLIREALSIFEKLGSPNAEIARENLARVEGEAG